MYSPFVNVGKGFRLLVFFPLYVSIPVEKVHRSVAVDLLVKVVSMCPLDLLIVCW